MADFLTKVKRSALMASIRGRGNKGTELALANLFRQNKITGWRRHYGVFGRPDFVFKSPKLAIFVDGCFWHSCPKHGTQPSSRRAFWRNKFARNKARDRRVNRKLREIGWSVLRIWEHDLKKPDIVVRKVKSFLKRRRLS